MTERIIFCVESFFQQRDYARFGIEILSNNGFQVEIWEIFRPFRPEYAKTYSPPDPSSYKYIKRFEQADDIYREIRHLGPHDAVLAPWGWSNVCMGAGIFRALASSGVYFGSVVMGTGMGLGGNQARNLSSIADGIYRRFPHWLRRTRPFDYLFLCGGTALQTFTNLVPEAAHIWAHTLDYDLILESELKYMGERKKHIVFLDEYVPFHPDYSVHGIAAPNTAAEYYPKLTQLFLQLEEQLGLPVVIAAHPRANYSAHHDYFEGRRVVQGHTCALVRDSVLVLTHCSVANNFTIAFRKPALVLTTSGLTQSLYGPPIESMARMLGCPLINLDHLQDQIIRIPVLDEEKYSQYFNRIIKRDGTSRETAWQIFAKHLRNRNAEFGINANARVGSPDSIS